MPNLSHNASLQRCYTNHSISGTCITILDKKGFEARDIMTVSSHKCEETIKSYSITSDTRKREMSTALSNALVQSPKILKKDDANVTPSTSTSMGDGNVNNSNNNPEETPTIRELLQLTSDQEKEFYDSILGEDFLHPDTIQPSQPNVNINTSNIQNKPITSASLLPKMLFNNSNITINFIVQK